MINSRVRLRKKSMTCYIELSQWDKLHELSKVTRVPMSVIIREGIDMVLDVYERRLVDVPDNG